MSISLRRVGATALTTMTVLAVTAAAPVWAGPSAARPPGQLVLVQAVPGQVLDVSIDGRSVGHDSSVGAVLGPFSESPGRHRVELTDPSGALRLVSMVEVTPGSSKDVVVHLPAQVGGSPVVNSYRTPRAPIAPGKARVLIAHTATVAPADVRVDGKVVFHDIANGEYATADVAAGGHTVALLPAGLDTRPILGPLHVDLTAGTVTMVYAVGNPRAHSMNVIVHRAALTSNGAVAPETIDTGSAGLAADVRVVPFRAPVAAARRPGGLPSGLQAGAGGLGLVLLGAAALAVRRPRRRAAHRAP